jgi:uncharacterized protein (TIGR03083 family)
MDAAHRLDALRTEGGAAARAAEDRLDVAVPHLEWNVGEVLGHLGGVHRRFTRSLRGEVDEWPERGSVAAPSEGLLDWYRTSMAELVGALGSIQLEDSFVTFAGEKDGHWILRRLANETAVHRWDIEAASGPPEGFDSGLAIDIVDEFLTDIVGEHGLSGVDDIAVHDGATLHLHATDTDAGAGEWFLTVAGDGLHVDRRHEKGDVALRGPSDDLALWINGRIPASRLDSFGAPENVDWWSRACRFG